MPVWTRCMSNTGRVFLIPLGWQGACRNSLRFHNNLQVSWLLLPLTHPYTKIVVKSFESEAASVGLSLLWKKCYYEVRKFSEKYLFIFRGIVKKLKLKKERPKYDDRAKSNVTLTFEMNKEWSWMHPWITEQLYELLRYLFASNSVYIPHSFYRKLWKHEQCLQIHPVTAVYWWNNQIKKHWYDSRWTNIKHQPQQTNFIANT